MRVKKGGYGERVTDAWKKKRMRGKKAKTGTQRRTQKKRGRHGEKEIRGKRGGYGEREKDMMNKRRTGRKKERKTREKRGGYEEREVDTGKERRTMGRDRVKLGGADTEKERQTS